MLIINTFGADKLGNVVSQKIAHSQNRVRQQRVDFVPADFCAFFSV
jgi:hypothetical protein